MTTDAAFKRRVRARMRKTGERYATARRHVDAEQGAARRPAAATRPLLAIGSNPLHAFAGASVQLTPAGGEVLAGRADHVRVNGVDRWIGVDLAAGCAKARRARLGGATRQDGQGRRVRWRKRPWLEAWLR
jgi:hypothetical protein